MSRYDTATVSPFEIKTSPCVITAIICFCCIGLYRADGTESTELKLRRFLPEAEQIPRNQMSGLQRNWKGRRIDEGQKRLGAGQELQQHSWRLSGTRLSQRQVSGVMHRHLEDCKILRAGSQMCLVPPAIGP